jgi:nucleoside-diphosphate-sugar epimerase
MRSILITGADGMVGRNLTKFYHQRGTVVTPFEGDCTKASEWEKYSKLKYHAIIHLAAYPGVRTSFEMPDRYYYNNTMCMENFLVYGVHMTDKLLYASSSNAKEWWLNPYAGTKKMCELMARRYKAVGMRFHTVFPGRDDMLFRKLERGDVTYVNKHHTRDFIHVRDLCEAIDTIVKNFDSVYNTTLKPGTHSPGVVDIGTGHTTPVPEVAKIMGYTGEYVETEAKGERESTRADVEYLLKLGWTPKRNILDVNCHTE